MYVICVCVLYHRCELYLFIPRWNHAYADARQRCTHVVAVDRKKGLRITDYSLMSCDTAGHHVTLILLGWL